METHQAASSKVRRSGRAACDGLVLLEPNGSTYGNAPEESQSRDQRAMGNKTSFGSMEIGQIHNEGLAAAQALQGEAALQELPS